MQELLKIKPNKGTPYGFRIARLMRLWYFLVAPKIAIGIFLLGLGLLFTPFQLCVIPAALGFAVPVLILILTSDIESRAQCRWLKLCWSVGRLFALNIFAMLGLYFQPKKQGAVGGRS